MVHPDPLGWRRLRVAVIREAEVARLRGRPTWESSRFAGGDEVERLERAAHVAVTRADGSRERAKHKFLRVYARQANGELRREP
jgi:hypothetical protein